MRNLLILIDTETLIRLEQPAATALLAISVMTLPITVKAYGDSVDISGNVTVRSVGGIHVWCEVG